MQEQNMKLARYSTGAFLQGAKKQREAMQAMLEGPFRVYTGLLYAPISSPRDVTRNGSSAEDGDLPVEGYDRLSVGEISGELGELSANEDEELKEYETKAKNRRILVERFDRSLVRSIAPPKATAPGDSSLPPRAWNRFGLPGSHL